jgi:hypothetical protein
MRALVDEAAEEFDLGEVSPADPVQLIEETAGVLRAATAQLEEDDLVLLMGTATTKGDARLAVVVRTAGGLEVTGWYQHTKATGHEAGVGLIKRWKR